MLLSFCRFGMLSRSHLSLLLSAKFSAGDGSIPFFSLVVGFQNKRSNAARLAVIAQCHFGQKGAVDEVAVAVHMLHML